MYIKNPRQVPGDYFTNIAWARLPDSHRVLMVGLALLADPGGSNAVDLHRIRREVWQAGEEGACWPSISDVETYLLELEEAGFLRFYLDPAGSGTELYKITARWLSVHKQGVPVWLPPTDEHTQDSELPPFRNAVVGGARAGGGVSVEASEGARAGESAGARGSSSGTSKLPKLRLSPSAFCTEHQSSPPPDLDCRNCGTARERKNEHREARQARAAALAEMPAGPLRQAVLASLDAKIRGFEEAAARDLAGTTDKDPTEPAEYIDDQGRVDHT